MNSSLKHYYLCYMLICSFVFTEDLVYEYNITEGANLISLNYAGKTVSGTSGAFSAAAKKNAFANLFVSGAVTNAVGTFTLADNGLG